MSAGIVIYGTDPTQVESALSLIWVGVSLLKIRLFSPESSLIDRPDRRATKERSSGWFIP